MTNNIVYGSSIGVSFYARSDYNGNEGIVQANLRNMVIQACDKGILFSADNRGTANAVLSNSILYYKNDMGSLIR